MAFIAGLSVLAASCRRDEGGVSLGRTEVVFETATLTKAAVTAHEADILSLDLLVFRADNGALDTYKRVSGGTSVSAELPVGVAVRYHVIANAPAGILNGFSEESSFLSAKTYLYESTASSLVMHGAGSFTVADGSPAVPVSLDRYVSKVSVRSVEVKWFDSFVTPPAVSVGRVALINALGEQPWSGTPATGSLWYNKMGVVHEEDGSAATANVMDMVCASPGVMVSSSAPVTLEVSLYAMPNPTSNGVNSDTNPEWSVRNTRVALELLVDGASNWYAVDLPAMQGNRHYVITKMTILGPGSDDPDKPVSRSEIEMTLVVAEWEDIETDVLF